MAERLQRYAGEDDVVVLGLPRGGVPVAYEVAQRLGAPLDVFVVRKLGVPGREELAFGAIATGGVRVLADDLLERLDMPSEWLEAIDARERRELARRERVYRGERPPPELAGRVVILVDDGLATGATMLAAVQAVREQEPARVVVAVPVADPGVCERLGNVADEVVCVSTPRPMLAVGAWYEDFSQVSDDQVRELLSRAQRPPGDPAPTMQPLAGASHDYDGLLARAVGARHVLIGEASHGTHEFYRERAEITKRLIAEGGCAAVAVEADWPDAYRVNRFVRGIAGDASAEQALRSFRRFPVWMWRNAVVEEFVSWLRRYNDALPAGASKVGFYGLDLYSLHASIDAVVAYLDEVDPQAAARARERYACFDQFGRDPQLYAYEAGLGGAEPCEQAVLEQLLELSERRAEQLAGGAGGGREDPEDGHFFAEQNARLVVDAERYYRAMFRGGVDSWNLRDRHMADTLARLAEHLERTRGEGRTVVWEHNSHLGDNRATELGQAGQLNVGQLTREHWGEEHVLLVGFTTYRGTVTAASQWGGPAERRNVRPALAGSWEELLHERTAGGAVLFEPSALPGRRLERAIGVIYQPQTERLSHYFHARLREQFDAVVHIDETTAVEPLDPTSEWEAGELPATYPTGV